jgi:hypothetical protein
VLNFVEIDGGVIIFVHKSLNFTNVQEFGKEQYIGVCAVKLNWPDTSILIISIYRSPSGNFIHF